MMNALERYVQEHKNDCYIAPNGITYTPLYSPDGHLIKTGKQEYEDQMKYLEGKHA